LKATINGIVYDTDRSQKLAHKASSSSDAQLFQTDEGRFFLLTLQLYVDGQKLGPTECWVDLRTDPKVRSRLKVVAEITAFEPRHALEWVIKTQIPSTLRGYLLESI